MTKPRIQIATEIVEAHPQASRMKSAHKLLLASMIAEELEKRLQEGHEDGYIDGLRDAPENTPEDDPYDYRTPDTEEHKP